MGTPRTGWQKVTVNRVVPGARAGEPKTEAAYLVAGADVQVADENERQALDVTAAEIVLTLELPRTMKAQAIQAGWRVSIRCADDAGAYTAVSFEIYRVQPEPSKVTVYVRTLRAAA